MRLPRLILCVALGAGCGGQATPASTLHNSSDAPATIAASDALALMDRFATALEKDDASALADLVDPAGGVRVWRTPGVAAVIDAHITADGGPPSKQLTFNDPDSGLHQGDPKIWAQRIRAALAIVDVEPANADDPKYSDDCATNQGPRRAELVSKPVPQAKSWPYYAEDGKIDRDLDAVVYRLNFGAALSVWIVKHGGRLYISDLFTSDACSA